MPETILSKRVGLPLCVLGDLTATPPGIGAYRNDFFPSAPNYEYGQSYPTTAPDNIVRKVRAYNGPSYCPGPPPRLVAFVSGGVYTSTCNYGFPASPAPGSPVYTDDRGTAFTNQLYPRYSSETAYSWGTSATGQLFTPNDFPQTSSAFDYSNGLLDTTNGRSLFMSYNFTSQPNDPSIGGDTSYIYETEVRIYYDCAEAACWNDGAQIDYSLDIRKIDATLAYVPGTYGAHTFTYGSDVADTTLTRSFIVDAASCAGSLVLVDTITIPSSNGYVTYLDDYYVTAVTAP